MKISQLLFGLMLSCTQTNQNYYRLQNEFDGGEQWDGARGYSNIQDLSNRNYSSIDLSSPKPYQIDPCNGIDDNGDGYVDRTNYRGDFTSTCPIRCTETEGGVTRELIDYEGLVVLRVQRLDYCFDERTIAHHYCTVDRNNPTQSFISIVERYCDDNLYCVGSPAHCGERK